MIALPREPDIAACRFQADVFEKSASVCTCSSAVFVRRFMKSNLAKDMDTDPLSFGVSTPEAALRLIEEEYGTSSYGSVRYSEEVLRWMGYLFRYWASAYGESSRNIYRIVGARELCGLFEAYHCLDPDQAIERILESKGLNPQLSIIDKGVKELRRIRNEGKYEYYIIELPELIQLSAEGSEGDAVESASETTPGPK